MAKSRSPQEMYLPIDEYKRWTYPCFYKSISLSKSGNNNLILDHILLYTSNKEEFAYSFLYIKYNEIIYEKLPFEGHVLTKDNFLLIDTIFNREMVIPTSSFIINNTIDDEKIGKEIFQYGGSNSMNSIIYNQTISHTFYIPLTFLFIFSNLFIATIIYLYFSCRERKKEVRKLKVASTIIEKEWIVKTLSKLDKDNNFDNTKTENSLTIK
uniref:Uncharacterized protein n=1 Tax=Strongyloides stercoralis TaxID=6248 RepID=A0A0K0EKJ3_STRER